MNILYIGYWNLYDPLTISTVFPTLRVLRDLHPTAKLIFVNIQREALSVELPPILEELGILYHPIKSGESFRFKISDFAKGPGLIKTLCKTHYIARIIAQGAPAGSLAYLAWKKTGIPFLVESFEPHADYMLESKVWSRFDLRFILQHYSEQMQKKHSAGLLPVTVNYQIQLREELVESKKIKVVPCVVNENQFAFNMEVRLKVRKELRIDQGKIVGLYAGKYDGLYLATESFQLYKIIFDQLPDFVLIILSSTEYHSWIKRQIRDYRLPVEKIIIKSVSHDKVGNYCSASDFAFATYKQGQSKAYLSPVKVGEYWVSGLPILMTRGIGDESRMMENGFGGVLFDPDQIGAEILTEKIDQLVAMAREPGIRKKISAVGINLRSVEKLKSAYEYFLRPR